MLFYALKTRARRKQSLIAHFAIVDKILQLAYGVKETRGVSIVTSYSSIVLVEIGAKLVFASE